MESTSVEIVCKECRLPFEFSVGEQQFYAERRLILPHRCKPCRAAKKARIAARELSTKSP